MMMMTMDDGDDDDYDDDYADERARLADGAHPVTTTDQL